MRAAKKHTVRQSPWMLFGGHLKLLPMGPQNMWGVCRNRDIRWAQAMWQAGGEGGGRRKEEVDAGRCVFKTRTQHHRMVGENDSG
eukprot:3086007-Pyramimonas_sp.AAC.1